jgi:ABC-2 type transport system ATP-binding protein
MTAAIRAEDLVVRYGKRVALNGVSVAVEPGTVYALLGRNGAGKSSLVRTVLGQRRADRGGVMLFGQDVWRNRQQLMDRVGVVPEESDAPPEMRVRELEAFCGQLYSRWNRDAFTERIKRFGIDASARSGDLSKGQKKQVALALALASSPELLLLDDPTLGLDVVARKSLFEEVIAEMADRGVTVFITTHDLPGVEAIADRVGILTDGVLALEDDMETLKSRLRRIRFATQPVALSAFQSTSVRRWGNGTEAVVSNYDDVSFERFREEARVQIADVSPMSLEEIFIAVTGGEGGAQ